MLNIVRASRPSGIGLEPGFCDNVARCNCPGWCKLQVATSGLRVWFQACPTGRPAAPRAAVLAPVAD
eukprot:15467015-Alexandrium_andersonii.AAC.1